MKHMNKTILITALSTLIIGVLIGWLVFGGSNRSTTNEHQYITNTENETIWTCSMHPQIRQQEPGDCPICGMDLIPLESDNNEIDPMAVSMSPTAMQLAQVQTIIVGQGSAEKSIQLNGKVQVDERLLFTQSSHVSGRIEKLGVKFTGEFVSEGQVIAYLYSPELVTAQEELFEAKKIAETQPALFKAAKEKLKKWKLTEEQIDQILSTGKAIEQFPILANVSGYVTEKMVNLGDYIKQGEAIYEIVDLSKVWVLFDVYESEMNWIKNGASVSYSVQSIPGQTFDGTVSYIDPIIDPKTRVAKARVVQNNPTLLLKPEMFVSGTVESKISSPTNSLTVPKSAVMWTGQRSVVYVMQSTTQGVNFMMREVTLGRELGESYVIESGLEVGEEIAVNGTFSIDAAAQLAGKPSMMNPDGGVAMTGHNHCGDQTTQMISTSVSSEQFAIHSKAKEALQPLFSDYFEMKDALVNDNFEKAKEAGTMLKNRLEKIDMNLFEDDAHSVWMQQFNTLATALEHINHLNEIKTIRDKFKNISSSIVAIAESFDPVSYSLFIQHCPMADSNNGADWLSQEREIRNPYFGESMLTCGEVTKEIN